MKYKKIRSQLFTLKDILRQVGFRTIVYDKERMELEDDFWGVLEQELLYGLEDTVHNWIAIR